MITTAKDEGLVRIVREFNAPREVVFRAWTEPEQLLRWYAPAGCSIHFRTCDVRPGGHFHSCIVTPEGHECWCAGEYSEVSPPERLVHTMRVANAAGEFLSATEAGMDAAWPDTTILTITFDDLGGRTRLTLCQTVEEALARRTGAYPSWLSMFDRLAELVSGTRT